MEVENDTPPPLQPVDYDSHSFLDILSLFPDVTSSSLSVGHKQNPFEHILEVEGLPVALRPRRLSVEKAKALDLILDDMLTKNIIKSSCSPWASPVHLLKKKNGSFRLVHDYRIVNSRTKKQSYSLPRISDLTQQIRGATIFSSLDLKNAFWQLDVKPSDRKFTAFCTNRGNFKYNKLPQGLTYASHSFQKFINHVMRGTESFCFCYVDNLIVFSSDEYEHKTHLHDIVNRLNAYSLQLNLSKCLLGVTELNALGYTLSAQGITASRDKINAVLQLPEPTTIKELRQVLGLINYQRHFIPNAAGIMAPLTAYLKGHVTNSMAITLNAAAQKAFSDI